MDIQVEKGSIENFPAEAVIVNLFAGVNNLGGATGALDAALDGAISELIAGGDLSGKLGETAVLYPRAAIPAKRVIVVGLGKKEEFNLEAIRRAAAAAIKRARDLNARQVATIVHGAGIAGFEANAAAQATVEGSLLALYNYAAPKHGEASAKSIESLSIVEFDESKIAAIQAGVEVAQAIAAGVTIARDLINMPPNVATPTKMAEVAKEIAKTHDAKVTVGGRRWAKKHDMGAFLAVAKGAGEKPKFIVLEHHGGDENQDTVVLVGKGITFDTGGISLKPGLDMEAMKSDMGGAAAVLGAMKSIALLNLPLNVVGIVPSTENMPDAEAYRPADVITASNGKTIEIISTDAEGRMVLADALVYAGRYNPVAVIDLATLTGACVIALGRGVAAGLFSNDESLRDKLIAASSTTHERLWPLPLWEDYRRSIDTDVADMKNSGGRFGGVGTSAVFLQEFTNYSWAHLDIAGMALRESAKDNGYVLQGGTGFGVRLLVEFLRNW